MSGASSKVLIKIPFEKWEALGNDFVLLDRMAMGTGDSLKVDEKFSEAILDRRFGVGGDELMVLRASGRAHAFLEFWNPDGTSAEMCGNGIRAVALFLREKLKLPASEAVRVDGILGVKTLRVDVKEIVSVPLATARFGRGWGGDSSTFVKAPPGEAIEAPGLPVGMRFLEVDVGNPHAVFIVPDLKQVKVREWGPIIESHPLFPKKTNVEFVEVQNGRAQKGQSIPVKVWERGSGETLACGTGACAVAGALYRMGIVAPHEPARLRLPGGILSVQKGAEDELTLIGPARRVFRGEIEL